MARSRALLAVGLSIYLDVYVAPNETKVSRFQPQLPMSPSAKVISFDGAVPAAVVLPS